MEGLKIVDKNHPDCPMCGGGTTRNLHMKDWKKRKVYECVTCGASHDRETGEILKESN